MPDVSSLMSQAAAGGAPQAAQEDGRAQALQGLMQQRQAGPGARKLGPPTPNYQQTVGALQHMSEFQRHWKKILQTPNIGKVDIRGQVVEMISDLMGEEFITLPQSMQLLSSFPSQPLQQRQWVEQHYANDVKASAMLLKHHAQAQPRIGTWDVESKLAGTGKVAGKSPKELMTGLVDHYKARAPRSGANA